MAKLPVLLKIELFYMYSNVLWHCCNVRLVFHETFSSFLISCITDHKIECFSPLVSEQQLSNLVHPVRCEEWWNKRAPREKSSFSGGWMDLCCVAAASSAGSVCSCWSDLQKELQWGTACPSSTGTHLKRWQIFGWYLKADECSSVRDSRFVLRRYFFIQIVFNSLSSVHKFYFVYFIAKRGIALLSS